MLHPTSVTNIVDRLEQQGLVHRVAHPTDRRTKLAEINDDGRRIVDKATEAVSATGFGMGALDGADSTRLTAMLRKLRVRPAAFPADAPDIRDDRAALAPHAVSADGRAWTSPVWMRHNAAYRPGDDTSSSWVPDSTTRPASSTWMRSAWRTVDSRWAITMTVRSRPTSSSERWMEASVSLSTAEVASSSTSTGGSLRMARAIDSRWRWPPDSFWPRSPTTVS